MTKPPVDRARGGCGYEGKYSDRNEPARSSNLDGRGDSETAVVLKHHLLIELQVTFNVVDYRRFRVKMHLHVITMLLLGIVGENKFFASQAFDLLELCSV